MDLPSYPDAGDSGEAPGGSPQSNLAARILIGIVVAAVVVVILLHLTGVVGPLGN